MNIFKTNDDDSVYKYDVQDTGFIEEDGLFYFSIRCELSSDTWKEFPSEDPNLDTEAWPDIAYFCVLDHKVSPSLEHTAEIVATGPTTEKEGRHAHAYFRYHAEWIAISLEISKFSPDQLSLSFSSTQDLGGQPKKKLSYSYLGDLVVPRKTRQELWLPYV